LKKRLQNEGKLLAGQITLAAKEGISSHRAQSVLESASPSDDDVDRWVNIRNLLNAIFNVRWEPQTSLHTQNFPSLRSPNQTYEATSGMLHTKNILPATALDSPV
jgi:hypothetical protein